MKKTAAILLFIVFLTCNTPSLFAQQQKPPTESPEKIEKMVEDQIERYREELALDQLQAAILKANFMKYIKKSQKVIQGEGDRKEKNRLLKKLGEEQQTELAVYFSEEQLESLKKIQEKEQRRRIGEINAQRNRLNNRRRNNRLNNRNRAIRQ